MIPFRAKLIASYVCAALVLLVGIVAFLQSHEVSAERERSSRLRIVMRSALEMEVLLLHAEAGMRAYLATSDTMYLDDYEAAVPLLTSKAELLEGASEGVDGPPRQRVAQLVYHTETQLAGLAEVREAHMHGRAISIEAQRALRKLSQEIRLDVAALVSNARSERDLAEASADRLHTFARWFVGLGNLVAFLLAIAATTWIGGAIRESIAARQRVENLAMSLSEANDALQRSNADLEQFSYVASHDLRAPLRGIANLAEWIEEELGDTMSSETQRHFEALRARVQRLDALVVGIATYSRAGRSGERLERVDVGALVRDVLDLVAPPSTAQITIADNLPTVDAPRVPMQQIFLNLVSNANKHGLRSDGGAIEITSVDEGAHWRFVVRDYGPGIAPAYHAKIFELFQTLTPRDRVEGSGIGLSLVRKLVRRYGGEVSVASAPQEGSAFSFTWPKDLSICRLGHVSGRRSQASDARA